MNFPVLPVRCVITGLGAVTPLGRDLSETWSALIEGRRIVDLSRAQSPDMPSVARVSALAIRSAEQAISAAGWSRGDLASDDVALIVGTSKGPVDAWLAHSFSTSSYGLDCVARDVAAHLRLGTGPRLTVAAACSSGLQGLIRATMLIAEGRVTRALVVSAESSLHPLFTATFGRLGVLASKGRGCRPFCTTRDGFVLSESSSALCIERASSPGGGLAIDRVVLAADATHLVAGDALGVAMEYACRSLGLDLSVDLIHAHGTGTELNDSTELRVFERALKWAPSVRAVTDPFPNVYSHKGALGHSLGAAGLLALVLSARAHQTSIIPPNVPMDEVSISCDQMKIARRPVDRPVRRSVTIASGFGGGIAGVSLLSG